MKTLVFLKQRLNSMPTALAIFIFSVNCCTGTEAAGVKYQWAWDKNYLGLLDSVRALPQGYAATISFNAGENSFDLTLERASVALWAWRCHAESTFVIDGDLVFYADYSPIASGAKIICRDIPSAKTIWSINVQGVQPRDHSQYRNRVFMTLDRERGNIVIRGSESHGRYVEALSADTGTLVFHNAITDPIAP